MTELTHLWQCIERVDMLILGVPVAEPLSPVLSVAAVLGSSFRRASISHFCTISELTGHHEWHQHCAKARITRCSACFSPSFLVWTHICSRMGVALAFLFQFCGATTYHKLYPFDHLSYNRGDLPR